MPNKQINERVTLGHVRAVLDKDFVITSAATKDAGTKTLICNPYSKIVKFRIRDSSGQLVCPDHIYEQVELDTIKWINILTDFNQL